MASVSLGYPQASTKLLRTDYEAAEARHADTVAEPSAVAQEITSLYCDRGTGAARR